MISPATIVGQNLRYLLWRRDIPSEEWVGRIAVWLKGEREKAAEVLRGNGFLDDHALTEAASFGKVEPEDILYKDLLAEHSVRILLENLRSLMSDLPKGAKRILAKQLNVHPSTISRWISGKQDPEQASLDGIAAFFKMPAGTDLRRDPLFLSPYPNTDDKRRRWLEKRIRGLNADVLYEIFPALSRMMSKE